MIDHTTIERVARTMYSAERLTNRHTGRPLEWADLTSVIQKRWRIRARSAVITLREPGDAARHAVRYQHSPVTNMWEPMIDAILDETPR